MPAAPQDPAAVGDEGHRATVEAGVGAQDLGRVVGLEFKEIVAVEHSRQHFLDVVRLAVVFGHQVADAFHRLGRLDAARAVERTLELAELLADHLQAFLVVGGGVVGHAADAGVRFGAAVASIPLGEAQRAVLTHHQDHVAERGQQRA